jgi:hypothetical protein
MLTLLAGPVEGLFAPSESLRLAIPHIPDIRLLFLVVGLA